MAVTYAEVVWARVEESPDTTAFLFLGEDGIETSVTYLDLYVTARGIADALQAAPGEPVLLLLDPGFAYVASLFACLLSGAPAVPAFPPDRFQLERSMSRIGVILEDSTARVVLTTEEVAASCADLIRAAAGTDIDFLAVDRVDPSSDGPQVIPSHTAPALLQYTSGSTSAPRGVIVTQENLAANCDFARRAFDMPPDFVGVSWLPPYHDMGLVGFILLPPYIGMRAVLMSPAMFLRKPVEWLRAITRHRALLAGGPNFAYDLCVRRVKPEDRADLDLSSWGLTFNGAEPVRPDTLTAFTDAFAEAGFQRRAFYPCYGLAEATLLVTGGARFEAPRVLTVEPETLAREGRAVPADEGRPLVSVGWPDPGHELVIVDVDSARVLADGEVGEIWLKGPSVAAGYWRRDKETAESFEAVTADGRGPFLRTGDLGFIHDGELFVTGRMKDVVIVNGRNIYPADVERVCELASSGIRRGCGVTFGIENDAGEERIAVVYEVRADDEAELSEILDDLRRAVTREVSSEPEAIVLVEPRSVAKTSSGKVQRWVVREQYLEGGLATIAEWSRAEREQAGGVAARGAAR
jgi:acyl-CoA synthetase (AMP-forming)/AMP-acid ligase II